MKKTLFILTAMLAVVFTSCEVKTSEVTVSVVDTEGNPMNNREVLYTDMASLILDAALPSPESLVTGIPEGWEYATTNAQGIVTLKIDLGVKKLTYYFEVFDYGSNKWVENKLELKKGENAEVEFVVNK